MFSNDSNSATLERGNPPSSNEARFLLEVSPEEVWIPIDQTIHWGKRPNYIYPQIRLGKKEDLPPIPRGAKLVAKLDFCEWSYDDIEKTGESMLKKEMGTTNCLEEEKTTVPFEKGIATFRHLKIQKSIKLKKAETIGIRSLKFEIGFSNPFNNFKSLDIFLSKPVNIHIVAHKGSVKMMQRNGILPASQVSHSHNPVMTAMDDFFEKEPIDLESLFHTSKPLENFEDFLMDSAPKFNFPPLNDPFNFPLDWDKEESKSQKRKEITSALPEENRKRMKSLQFAEIMEDLSGIQQSIDSLKGKVLDFMKSSGKNFSSKCETITKNIKLTDASTPNPIYFAFSAFRTHNLELAISLMKTFPFDINLKNSAGMALLHIATRHSFLEGVRWCIQQGANINERTHQNNTPLHLAYIRNDEEICRILNDANADTEAVNIYGLKPKDYKHHRKPLMKPIPKSAISVQVAIEGFPKPFFLEVWSAARLGSMDIVKTYIEQLSCDIDVKSTNGQTPLMCACEHQKTEVAKYLLECGAHVNARDHVDYTALHYAYMSGSQTLIDLLEKQYNADPEVKDVWGRKPSWYKPKH